MSGFEIAGIVLGAWPILIEGLKFYAEERGVIKDFCNCQPLVQSIYRQLKREKVTFENSSRCLFNAAAKQSDRPLADVAAMMTSPGDPRWTEVDDTDAEGIFSYKTATLYAEARKDIEQVLEKIQESLDKVPPKPKDKHTTRRQWERLLFTIKQDQLELQLTKAETLNRFLVNLTRENVMSSVPEPARRSARHYNTIREHAIMMAEALQKKLLGKECHCKSKHDASLVLEVRPSHKRTKSCCFHVLFGSEPTPMASLQRRWITWEAEIEALEVMTPSRPAVLSQQPPNSARTPSFIVDAADDDKISNPGADSNDQNAKKKRSFKGFWRSISPHIDAANVRGKSAMKSAAITATVTPISVTPKRKQQVGFEIQEEDNMDVMTKEIENLCATIATTGIEAAWYGVLISREERWQRIRRATKPCCTSKNIKMVSLAQLLSTELWKTKPRSKLGLKLASMVLQLYQTPWLSDDWGKEDIFFIQEEDGTVVTDKPFIRPRIAPRTTAATPFKPKLATINMNVPCLFALGVVLVELHYKKTIDELQKEEPGFVVSNNESPEVSSIRRTLLILRLIEKMEAGDNLEKVLKQCIKGPDGALTDTNKEELRDMVEEKIIVPLENEVLWLHGCSKIEQCI
ncbi:uncharacterized protein PAC_17456 [Phialocephala subalpina]|uniref:DUF7580 domain-containing protein n=1 Tax=Phialocephala subalpina TaxID=576137 RepID=A0A1L7XRK0_9HELO|nr:uncharacterized protein PAC_17456 [Phialocephala subalpina]